MLPDSSDDKIILSVGLNTEEAQTGITALGQKIKGVSEQDLGTTNVKSYKLQIRELTADLQKIEQVQGRNSQAFRDSARELGRLKVAARDFKDQIEAYDPSNKLAGIANIAKGASVGLVGAAGAMSLFGVSGQKAEEVMLRLQGILALSHFISSIHEISSGWRSFINVLGLGQTAAKAQTTAVVEGAVEQVAAIETTTAAVTAQQAAEAELAASTAVVNQLRIDSEEAVAVVKAEGLDANTALSESEIAAIDISKALQVALQQQTAAQLALNEAIALGAAETAAASEANVAQAGTQAAVTVAEEASTVAAVGFGTALKAIGIGLIISLIAYLVSNWDSLKKSITDLFPALANGKKLFDEVKEVAFGLGNVILKYLIAPIKVLIDLIKGDFAGAMTDLKKGFDVVNNFKEGAAKEAAKIAEEARKVELQKTVEHNERLIKELGALGKDTTDLQVKNQQLKNSLLDKDADDYQKKLLDGQSEITVIQNAAIKKRQDDADKLAKAAKDKADALKKSELDKLKSGNDAASKVILGGLRSQKEIEISDADFKYKALITIANKYGKDSKNLVEARGIEEARINKKYADQIKQYLEKADEETLNDFDKKRKEILKASEDALKNATPAEKNKIIQSQTFQLGRVDSAEKYSDAVDAAQLNETQVTDKNRATVGEIQDTPEVQAQKETAIRNAKLASLTAQYQKERDLAAYNYDKLKQLDADYQKSSHDLEDEATTAKIELAQKEQDAKLATYQVIGDALQGASDLLGKSTVAGKTLAVASATISTYLSAQKAYESVVSIPYVGPILAPIAAATAVAAGLASVKSILSVKVPGTTGGSGSAPSYSAPQINSTLLSQSQSGLKNGVQQVQVINQPDTKTQEPLKAYVVQKDLSNSLDRAAYLDRQATI